MHVPLVNLCGLFTKTTETEWNLSGFQDFFLQPIIKDRPNRKIGLPRIGTTSVFFFTQFIELPFEEAYLFTERWNNKYDLRQCDIILCPIHRNDHWSLVSIDTKQKIVEYYDSIIGYRKSTNAPRLMKRYIEEYYRRKGEKVVFTIKVRNDAPIQENGVD